MDCGSKKPNKLTVYDSSLAVVPCNRQAIVMPY